MRIEHNELQQAETDTFSGHHIERLNENQRELKQRSREISMMEDYIESVHDDLAHWYIRVVSCDTMS